jgi:hypothetical protein
MCGVVLHHTSYFVLGTSIMRLHVECHRAFALCLLVDQVLYHVSVSMIRLAISYVAKNRPCMPHSLIALAPQPQSHPLLASASRPRPCCLLAGVTRCPRSSAQCTHARSAAECSSAQRELEPRAEGEGTTTTEGQAHHPPWHPHSGCYLLVLLEGGYLNVRIPSIGSSPSSE